MRCHARCVRCGKLPHCQRLVVNQVSLQAEPKVDGKGAAKGKTQENQFRPLGLVIERLSVSDADSFLEGVVGDCYPEYGTRGLIGLTIGASGISKGAGRSAQAPHDILPPLGCADHHEPHPRSIPTTRHHRGGDCS